MTFAILALLPFQVFSKSPTQVKKPVTKDPITQTGLLDALRIGGLPPKALIQEIRSRGVAFELTPPIEVELRAAGAKPAVIDAVRANYRPFVGSLNVTATVPGAGITVVGIGNYTDKITALKLPPGHYNITGRKLGYRSATMEVDIKFGQTSNIELKLELLSTEELVALAKESYEHDNYALATILARAVLARQPEHIKAIALLASSLYMQGEYEESIKYFTRAISRGESVAIVVLQRHGGSWNGKTLSPGRLVFQQSSFEFYSLDYPDENFKVPYAKVVETSIKDQMRLNVKVRVTLPKNRKESAVDYNFYSTDGVATGMIVTCPQCLGKMRVILQILSQFRTGA